MVLLPAVLGKNEARAAGYDDVIFLADDGEVREASASNVFAIRAGHLVTPPLNNSILPGITRIVVLRCANAIELPVTEARLTHNDLLDADEVFLCSTTIDVLAVVRINEQIIADGLPGAVVGRLHEQMIREVM